ncbi:putative nwd2 protein [Mycena venus]|uniref:Putative nwd2 protein n=1 Tax=Mycena venus TaxID=2733690 RepID=A0A8H6XSW6_9AGAR|nr:putative nwd2 protein [Mycena venus]
MQTLCQRLQDDGRLGGSFFFKRGHATRGNAKVLFATLAYQLALHDRRLEGPISRSAEHDTSVVGRSMDVQLRKLMVEPSQSLNDTTPLILLIDGLDECEGAHTQQTILSLIGNVVRQHPSTFRFLVASRPESHICEKLAESSHHDLYDSVDVEQSFWDIQVYLRDEFARIHREHSETMGSIPTPWPSSDIVEMLVEKSSGYFIYASTVIKFIDDKNWRPTEQLQVVQNLANDDPCLPFEALDHLYIHILSGVPARSRAKLCNILCVIANFRLCLRYIEALLDLKSGDVRLTLRNLHSVLSIGSEYEEITIHHASFLDFLHDRQRSSNFYIGPGSEHRMNVACAVLQALSCKLNDPRVEIAWRLEPLCIGYITSVPPSPTLIRLCRDLNPDFFWWGILSDRSRALSTIKQLLTWLKGIYPLPDDLIQHWEDYRFMYNYEGKNTGLRPIEFHDIVQWLKASPNSPLELIERWNNYLEESKSKCMEEYSTDEDLEYLSRYRRGNKNPAEVPAERQCWDEDNLRCWKSALDEMSEEDESDDEDIEL